MASSVAKLPQEEFYFYAHTLLCITEFHLAEGG